MKILLACSSDYMAIPAAMKLQGEGMLSCILLPHRLKKRLLPPFVQSGFDEGIIHTTTKETLEDDLVSLVAEYKVDAVFVMTFPWKFSPKVLAAPVLGCINFHPGILPKYKGADPMFWQLKNREEFGGISVHLMTEELDAGPVITIQKMPFIPGETFGIHHTRLGALATEMVMPVTEIIRAGILAEPIIESEPALFLKPPGKMDVTIDWQQQSSAEIEALVNAANPKYNGAFTSIRNMEMAILEIGIADMNNQQEKIEPGTIVYIDALYGPIVACADGKFVRINTVCLPEGYISGSKLFSLGFGVGEKFK